LLVGGLGACQYLYSQLHKEFDPKGIMVLQPGGPRPWTAICRGAVIRGLSDAEIQSQSHSLVVSRVSRVSYGMSYRTRFDDDIHHLDDRIWDSQELCWKAENQMHWYLKRVSCCRFVLKSLSDRALGGRYLLQASRAVHILSTLWKSIRIRQWPP
jgi:hypothetical protein